jgi:hypothetical protein
MLKIYNEIILSSTPQDIKTQFLCNIQVKIKKFFFRS